MALGSVVPCTGPRKSPALPPPGISLENHLFVLGECSEEEFAGQPQEQLMIFASWLGTAPCMHGMAVLVSLAH